MPGKIVFKAASLLYKLSYPAYKFLYFNFKRKQDAYEISLMKRLTRPGDVVLDIGANIGFFAALFCKWVGSGGKVFCFEPDRQNFQYLKKTIGKEKNVIINEVAVSDGDGYLTLYLSDKLNVDHRTYKPSSFKESYQVKTISIDDYLKNAHRVDIIKMDIQGAELAALKGMKSTLLANDQIKIFMEFWPYGLNMAGTSSLEIYNFFADQGFHIYHIADKKVRELHKNQLEQFSMDEKDYYNILVCKSLPIGISLN